MDLFDHDRRFLDGVDRVMDEARRRSGARWACRLGRIDCCVGPFPVNILDARRLSRALARMAGTDPQRAAAVEARARAARDEMAASFPGDAARGVLDDDDEEQQRFFDLHRALPCPALEPGTGACELYEDRPWTCRTYGPPLLVGDEALPPCPDCFAACSATRLEALRVEPDPEGLEAALLDALEREEGLCGETVIAWALLGAPLAEDASPRPGSDDQ